MMDVSSIGTVAWLVQAAEAEKRKLTHWHAGERAEARRVLVENEGCARMVEGLGVVLVAAEGTSDFTLAVSKIMRDMLVDLATAIRKRVQP